MDFTTWTTGERFLADGAQFQRRTDAEVDRKAVLARQSDWSPAGPPPKQPDQQPSLPPFAVRLCRSKSARDSRTPHRTKGLRPEAPALLLGM